MARKAHEIEINDDSPDEDIELVILAAQHSSDVNILRNAARAQALKTRRERQFAVSIFNAQEDARVKAQKFQAAQLDKLIEATNIDADYKKSLAESFTASETLTIASSSATQAGFDGIAGATDSTAEVVADYIMSPPTTEDEYESKIAALQDKVIALERQITVEGDSLTGSFECRENFEREIKNAQTAGERWRCWAAFGNCLTSELIKSINIKITVFGGGDGD